LNVTRAHPIAQRETREGPCAANQQGQNNAEHGGGSVSTKKGTSVNKQELIDAVAKSADISKAAAGRALDSAIVAIKGSLKRGQTVTLVGFGTFYVGKRQARSGRNPRTGASIKIRAAKVPKFRPGKALKDSVN
jgi:DNA-binding protein HU-beta